MNPEDTIDVDASLAAIVADALAVFGGFMLAVWVFFDSGWMTPALGTPGDRYSAYSAGTAIATFLFLLIYRSLGLYVRPQLGSFSDKIPRIVRANVLGILLTMAAAFTMKNRYEYSTKVILIAAATVTVLVLLERLILFRLEIVIARNSKASNRILILGTGIVAAHLRRAISNEPRLRSEAVGFLRTSLLESHTDIKPDEIKGTIEEFQKAVEGQERIDQVILTDSSLDHDRVVSIIIQCEQNLISFKLVPDIFRILTGSVDFQTIGDIPLFGVGRWPLDVFWNRVVKRLEDIAGSVFGMLITAPLIAVLAVLIKRGSPGPVFYGQERCGKGGEAFTLYKLRTMKQDAESETGPVWASGDDPRRTKLGGFLRSHNLDELPQLWNVFRGDMSLVGPRPERPHFVEQFKEDIAKYMWRHVSKPGMTGWAQVNGLRGNSSITERVKHDLYYLENWSLAFDFKIMIKTLTAMENAY